MSQTTYPYDTIIHDKSINVKGDNNVIIQIYADGIAARETIKDKWRDKKVRSLIAAEKLISAGYKTRGERVKNCSDIITYRVCKDCGQYHIARANLCRDRFCPVCSWRLSLQRFAAMSRVMSSLQMAYPEYKYSLVTLTVKNCNVGKLSETLLNMSAAWNLVINQRKIKPALAGWARSVEITYNKDTNEVHPHYHIIIMTPPEEITDLKIIEEWLRITAKKGIKTDIKAQNTNEIQSKNGENLIKSILETVKYSLKSDQMAEVPTAQFRQLVSEISSKRLFSSGGLIKDYMKNCGVSSKEMESATDENEITINCRDCGTEMIETLYKWSFGEKRYIKT